VFNRDRAQLGDRELLSLSRPGSVDKSLQLIADWHKACRAILDRQLTKSASTLAFFVSRPSPEPWTADSRITVLGDAGHPMPPVGGVGANIAKPSSGETPLPHIHRTGPGGRFRVFTIGFVCRIETW